MSNSGKYIESELNKLFEKWNQVHIKDEYEYSNLYNVLNKSTFLSDGIIDPDKWDFGPKVLYISRESNIQDELDLNANLPKKIENIFYMKRAYEGIDCKFRFYKNIEYLHKYLFESNDLGDSAFMNLNKRGGLSSIDPTLNKYVNKYADFIEKEIEIIDPKIIVCLGVFGTLNNKKIFKKYNFTQDLSIKYLYQLNNIQVLDMFHPSRKGKEAFVNKWYKRRFSNLNFIK